MSMKCQGKLDICRGKVREMSGNFDIAIAWEPCPLLYCKTGVCRGIPIFLIFAPKYRLWVLVRTASLFCQSKNKKNIKKNSNENFQFLHLKKSLYIAWACFRNVQEGGISCLFTPRISIHDATVTYQHDLKAMETLQVFVIDSVILSLSLIFLTIYSLQCPRKEEFPDLSIA